MNAHAFMSRLFDLRVVRYELRVNPGMSISAGRAILVVHDYRVPPYVGILTERSTENKQVIAFRPQEVSE